MQQQAVQQPGATQLRDWMKRRGFDTQDEVAGFLGIDPRFVSQFMNERRRPGLRLALVIERKTGIPVEAWALSEVDNDEDEQPVTSRKRNIRKV
jgi:transcriptional regulator with XRE-family HTH domain